MTIGADSSSSTTPAISSHKRTRRTRNHSVPGSNQSGRVSMHDVARAANVSTATVSKVLNDHPQVSMATRVHVRRFIDKLNYQPNRLAQGLSSKFTGVLAILLPELNHVFSDPYFGELISGIFDAARRLDYKIMVEHVTDDFVRDRKHIELFDRRYVDGALCLGLHDHHSFLKEYVARENPVMSVNNYFPDWGLDYVCCDYRTGATQVMNYLQQMGHKKIVMIAGARGIQTIRDMTEVYLSHARRENPSADESWIARGGFTEEGGAKAMAELVRRHRDLTAVFATSDKMALGAMYWLQHHNISVPGTVSVVGFDDLKEMAYINPNLTTVHLPLYDVGVSACDALVSSIRGHRTKVAQTFETHMVLRESTSMPRGFSQGTYATEHNSQLLEIDDDRIDAV